MSEYFDPNATAHFKPKSMQRLKCIPVGEPIDCENTDCKKCDYKECYHRVGYETD